jgi:hypothetical protein
MNLRMYQEIQNSIPWAFLQNVLFNFIDPKIEKNSKLECPFNCQMVRSREPILG